MSGRRRAGVCLDKSEVILYHDLKLKSIRNILKNHRPGIPVGIEISREVVRPVSGWRARVQARGR